MKQIKVLGTGYASCNATIEVIRQVAVDRGVDIELEKVEDIQQIIAYSVMFTPALVVDDEVVYAGGIPKRAYVEQWLGAA